MAENEIQKVTGGTTEIEILFMGKRQREGQNTSTPSVKERTSRQQAQ